MSSKPTTAQNSALNSTGTSLTEASNTSTSKEFYRLLDGVIIDDAKVFNTRLTEWENFYNFDRPHGSLNGQTPYERLKQKTTNSHPNVPDDHQLHTVATVGLEPTTSRL